MSTTLKTIFGTYESKTDGIVPRDIGGPGHSCRRHFSLVKDGETLGSVPIQGLPHDKIEQAVVGLLENQGFRRTDNRAPA